MQRCLLVLGWIFSAIPYTWAQQTEVDNPFYMKGAFHPWGYIIRHASELEPVPSTVPWGMQAEAGWHLNTQKVWDQCRCYPRTGFSLLFFDYRNPDQLGQSINLNGFIEPFFSFRHRFKVSFRMGGGLSYLTQVYDSISNPGNLFYSSPLSFMLRMQLGLHYQLTKRWSITASGHFQHISNGGISKPNKGMNFPTVSVGAVYAPRGIELKLRDQAKTIAELYPSRWQFRAFFHSGLKEVDQDTERKYPVGGLTGYASYVVGRINALHFGASYLWDGSIRQKKKEQDIEGNQHIFSVLGGHEFLLGRFIFSQALGVYLRKPQPDSEPIYHRWGLYYRFTDHWLVGTNLKAHRHIADVLDFRVGYTW